MNDPEPTYSDDATPPVVTHTRVARVDGELGVWTPTRVVAGTLRGLRDVAAAGEASAEEIVAALGDIADQLDLLTDGLAALGDSGPQEDQR